MSTFRSPTSARPERSLLSSLASSQQPASSNSGGLNSTLTSTAPRSYLQAQGAHSNYSRNISFSDDSVTANTTVGQRTLTTPQQEQQGRRGSNEESPTPTTNTPTPRGILCHRDSQFRYSTQPSPSSQRQHATPLTKSLPYRRQLQQQQQQHQQRYSPPLPLPPDVSPLENRSGDDTYGVRGKVVNFSVADSYQMTPRRAGSSSSPSSRSYKPSGDGGRGSPVYVNQTAGQSSLGQAYSMMDMDSVLQDRESTAATIDDEDRTTTTSGSYTINADDLCHEIDNLFFNDVVV